MMMIMMNMKIVKSFSCTEKDMMRESNDSCYVYNNNNDSNDNKNDLTRDTTMIIITSKASNILFCFIGSLRSVVAYNMLLSFAPVLDLDFYFNHWPKKDRQRERERERRRKLKS